MAEEDEMTPKEMYDKLSTEFNDEIAKIKTCVGDECKKTREDLMKKLKEKSITLDPSQLKQLTEDVDKSLKDDTRTHLKAINTRVAQYDISVKEQTKAHKEATKAMTEKMEELKKLPEELSTKVEAWMKSQGSAPKAPEAAPKVAPKAEEPPKPTPEEPPATPPTPPPEAPSTSPPEAPPESPPKAPKECPNCGFEHSTDKSKPKTAAACTTCNTGYTDFEVRDPNHELGGQGYKFCPTCGDALKKVTKKMLEEAKAKAKASSKGT